MRTWIAAAAAFALVAPAVADTKVALTGENTKITFVGTKKDGKHEGGFKAVTGSASVAGDDLTTLKVDVSIDTDSLYSDDPRLTGHLKGPDFFGVKANPKAKFVSTKVEKTEKGYTITGDLTLLGKTKSIAIPAQVSAADGKIKIDGAVKIDRNDFGMTYGKGRVDADVSLKVAVDAK